MSVHRWYRKLMRTLGINPAESARQRVEQPDNAENPAEHQQRKRTAKHAPPRPFAGCRSNRPQKPE